jgi:hypothetical protein
MRCDVCGKESVDAVYDSRGQISGTRGEPPENYWLCKQCASYRRGTAHVYFWLFAVALIICAVGLVASALLP